MLCEEERSPPGLKHRQISQLMFAWRLRMKKELKALPSALGIFRPTVGQCCQQCTPKSLGWKLLPPLMGFQNLLSVTETRTRYRGWLVRRLCCVLFVQGCRVYPDAAVADRVQRVWSSARVQKVLSLIDGVSEGKGRQQCLGLDTRGQTSHIFPLIKVHISPLLLRVSAWVLLKLLSLLFWSIQVNLSQMNALRRATEQGFPLVFVSQQQRILDYALISLTLFSYNMRVPYTMCHVQPSSICLRWVLQRLGVVIWPPSVEEDAASKALCGAVMTSFVTELLSEGHSLSLALDADTGQAVQWLTRIREAVRDGSVPDISLVPVGIAYDHAPQNALGGWDLLSLMQALISLLWRDQQGCVRLHFAQAFSLKEMCERKRCCMDRALPLKELLLPTILEKSTDALFGCRSMSWMLSPSCCPELPPLERQLNIGLALHLLYSTSACTAVMSTSLLSCLLLHKHRKGVHLSQLCQDTFWLLEEVIFRNRDVGFGGSFPEVVHHALSLLRPHLLLVAVPSWSDPLLVPRPSPAATLTLAGHCSLLTHVFIAEAVGACAVLAVLRKIDFCSEEAAFDVVLCQDKLFERTLQLCHLLPPGFYPPCQSAHCFALSAVDSLVRCGILVTEEQPQNPHVYDFLKRDNTLMCSSADDADCSDSDCEKRETFCYKLSEQNQCPERFFFLCSLLSVHLRALLWAIEALANLHRPLPELDCVMWLHRFLCDKAARDRWQRHESSSADMARVAVRTFIDLGVLQEEEEEGEQGRGEVYLGLSPVFQQPESRGKLQRFIQLFVPS